MRIATSICSLLIAALFSTSCQAQGLRSQHRQLSSSLYDNLFKLLVKTFDGDCSGTSSNQGRTLTIQCIGSGGSSASAVFVNDSSGQRVPQTLEVCKARNSCSQTTFRNTGTIMRDAAAALATLEPEPQTPYEQLLAALTDAFNGDCQVTSTSRQDFVTTVYCTRRGGASATLVAGDGRKLNLKSLEVCSTRFCRFMVLSRGNENRNIREAKALIAEL